MKDGVSEKYCGRCEDVYPIGAFNKHRGTKDGYQTQCRECIKEQRQRWASENPSKRRNRKLKAKYGLTSDCYNAILKSQNGKCKICESSDSRNKKYKYLVVDHCHKTGKVRGLLCDYCNVALGRFEDDIERIKKAIKYLEEHK